MNFNLVDIFVHMDILARTVALALLSMGLLSLSVFIERTWAYRRANKQSREFAAEATDWLAKEAYADLMEGAKKTSGSYLAKLIAAGSATYVATQSKLNDHGERVEVVKRDLQRRTTELGTEVRRGLGVLASVGSLAPFVGLLGTVVGIIAAFKNISATGSGGLSSVAGGIAEALVVTAMGLVVAIPAVLMFNRLSTQADAMQTQLEGAAGQFVDHVEFFSNSAGKRQNHAA